MGVYAGGIGMFLLFLWYVPCFLASQIGLLTILKKRSLMVKFIASFLNVLIWFGWILCLLFLPHL